MLACLEIFVGHQATRVVLTELILQKAFAEKTGAKNEETTQQVVSVDEAMCVVMPAWQEGEDTRQREHTLALQV